MLAILVAAWWAGLPRGAASPPKIEPADADARTRSGQGPFTALLWPQSRAPTARDDELCGYGPVPIVNDFPQIPPDIQAAGRLALANLADGLAARGSDRERAMGLYLRTVAAALAADAAWQAKNGACDSYDVPCMPALNRAMQNAAAESQQALVRLATITSDADAYALAVSSCSRPPGESPSDGCALLSAAQWARIEPDNAVPWMLLAVDAQRRGESGTLNGALSRASKARYSDPHDEDQIAGLIASDSSEVQSPAVQLELVALLRGIQAAAALGHPYYRLLVQYCTTSAPADPGRVQTCSDLAATLIEHGRPVFDVTVGAKILEQIGSSDPRLSAILDEAESVRWQWYHLPKLIQESGHGLLSCDSLQALRRNAAAQARLGESGRLRQQLAASGLTTAQAAQLWRAERQRLLQLSQAQKPAQ